MNLTKRIGMCGLVFLSACSSNTEVITDETCMALPVDVSPRRIVVAVGDSVRVAGSLNPNLAHCVSGTRLQYRWRVTNASIATVESRSDSTAVVKGLAVGVSDLSVKSVDGKLDSLVPIIVRGR